MGDVKRRVVGLEKRLAGVPQPAHCQCRRTVLLTYREGKEPPKEPVLCEKCGLPFERVVVVHERVVTVDDMRRRRSPGPKTGS